MFQHVVLHLKIIFAMNFSYGDTLCCKTFYAEFHYSYCNIKICIIIYFRYTLLITLENRQNEKYISLAEPIFLNIYSYDNIKTDFGPVKSNARYWWKRGVSYVGCDGLPYVTASRLIETDVGKYDWVAMSSSLGHLYMNQQKTLLNIACNILLEPLAKDVLNFESPNALDYFFKCVDTHKINQSLEIFLYGTALEMV